MIRVGQVGGAYGLEGAVKVLPLTDFDDRFAAGSRLVLEGAEREVEWSRPGHPGLVVKFHGIDNRTVADLFRGRYLEVEDVAARPLSEGRFYHHQVVGLAVLTSSGQPLGTIAEVLEREGRNIAALITELLQKDSARRPASAAQVAERLAEIERLPALRALDRPRSGGQEEAELSKEGPTRSRRISAM